MVLLPLVSLLFLTTHPNSLSELLNQSCELPPDKKIELISQRLIGTPFKESSIGESKGIDSDPVINLEYIDCVTFVEYVIAFVNSCNTEEFESHIRSLRYADREISFENRMHLPDFQWFLNALRYEYIKDITNLVGKTYTKKIKKYQKRPFYINKQLIETSKLISDTVEIEYIPYDRLKAVYNAIPTYSIVRIIREDSLRPYLTTHMGLVVQKGNVKYLRHSSRHFKRQVMDIPLTTYFSTFPKYKNWKVLGIAIYKINDIRKGRDEAK